MDLVLDLRFDLQMFLNFYDRLIQEPKEWQHWLVRYLDFSINSAPFVSELRIRELNLDREEQELSLTKAD